MNLILIFVVGVALMFGGQYELIPWMTWIGLILVWGACGFVATAVTLGHFFFRKGILAGFPKDPSVHGNFMLYRSQLKRALWLVFNTVLIVLLVNYGFPITGMLLLYEVMMTHMFCWRLENLMEERCHRREL